MPPRSTQFRAVTFMALLLVVVVGCGGAASVSPSPASVPAGSVPGSSDPAVDPSPSAAPSEGMGVDGIPTACYGLGDADCQRAVREVATHLTPADPAVRYIHVGPFGCLAGTPCPTTLAARPEGDITFESDGAALAFHVTATGDVIEAVRQESFGISLAPTTTPPPPGAPQPFTLGHCGLWSGIDLGGSWWDPVGFVDADHPDAINAAAGTIVFSDPDHALFTSKTGLGVQLLRRAGEKYLPFCQ